VFGKIDASPGGSGSRYPRERFPDGRLSAYRRVGPSIPRVWLAVLLTSDYWESLPVATANSIVRLTMSVSGFQDFLGPSRSSPEGFVRSILPSRKNDRSPQRSPATSLSFSRCWSHRGHSNRKCLTVSLALPVHSHWFIVVSTFGFRFFLRALFQRTDIIAKLSLYFIQPLNTSRCPIATCLLRTKTSLCTLGSLLAPASPNSPLDNDGA
jgi:hypothetical protein